MNLGLGLVGLENLHQALRRNVICSRIFLFIMSVLNTNIED